MSAGKSILAGLAGIATAVIPTLIADLIAHKVGLYAPPGQASNDTSLAIATTYRVLFGMAGSYVTARLAPNHPMGHSLALGALGMLIALGGAVATWNRVAEFGPHWYPIALVILSLPQSWAGAKIFLSQSSASASAK